MTVTPEMASLYEFVPHWEALVIGPEIIDGAGPCAFSVSYILTKTRDEALLAVVQHAMAKCDQLGLDFIPSEWHLANLRARNAN